MGGTNVIVMEVPGVGAQALLDLSDRFKQRSAPAAIVLGSREDGTVTSSSTSTRRVAEPRSCSARARTAMRTSS